MNDKLQAEMAAWLAELRSGLAQGKDFVIDQSPEFVREIVALGRAETTLALIATSIAFLVLINVSIRWWKYVNSWPRYSERDVAFIIGGIISAFGLITLVMLFGFNVHPFLSSWFAPRVYAIGQIAEMIGKATGK